MPKVKMVKIVDWVLPELRYRDTRALVGGGPNVPVPDKYFFGHSVTVDINVDDIDNCRLYWAEKTNLPIVPEQDIKYFVDMYKLNPNANTFANWGSKKTQGGDNKNVKITDIPAMPGGKDMGETHRWLEIIAIVHNTTDNSARKAHFRQDLLFYPKGGEQAALLEFQRILGYAPPNLQSVFGIRNYSYSIIQNDVELNNPTNDIAAIFTGAPDKYWK